MQRALASAMGLSSRSTSALWMLAFLTPAEVRRSFMGCRRPTTAKLIGPGTLAGRGRPSPDVCRAGVCGAPEEGVAERRRRVEHVPAGAGAADEACPGERVEMLG